MVDHITNKIKKLNLFTQQRDRSAFIDLVDETISQLKTTPASSHHMIIDWIIDNQLMQDLVYYINGNNRADQLRAVIILGTYILDDSAKTIRQYEKHKIIDRLIELQQLENNSQMLKFIYRALNNACLISQFSKMIGNKQVIQKAIDDFGRCPEIQCDIQWLIGTLNA